MLKKESNERICRTGPGTPMGDVFRRYWLPVALVEEVPNPDSDPVRVKILGEDLVIFRDTNGDVGLLDAYCPHRRAPLFFGRNEECGLRCVFHGWKFDVAGQCVDTPNEPPTSNFKNKVQIKSYPTWEKAGIVWTYMGPKELEPPKPDYEWLRAPETHIGGVNKTYEDANWLQGLEGGIDSSHSSFTHNNDIQNKNTLRNRATAPKLEVEKTSYGFTYASIRDLKEEGNYVRAYQYIFPAQQMRGQTLQWHNGESDPYPTVRGHIWVPIDDETCWVYNFMYSTDPNIVLAPEYVIAEEKKFGRDPEDLIPGTYHLKRNRSNDYLIDREVQRTKTFTGIEGVNTQDMALQEGMPKPFCDRENERLGTADLAIIAARQQLLKASETIENGDEDLLALDPETYRNSRACDKIIAKDQNWRDAMQDVLVAKY